MNHRDLFTPELPRPFEGNAFGTVEVTSSVALVADGANRATLADKVAAFLKLRPNEWIDGRDLMSIAGSYGWRTRISDCRRAPYNMRIDNRQRRVGRFTVSEYMYVPHEEGIGGAA